MQGLPVPQKILANRPGPETRSVKQLCLEAAKFHHQGGRSDDMLASLDRLSDVTDKIQFLLQWGHVTLAAPIMAQNGTHSYLFVRMWCFQRGQVIDKFMQFCIFQCFVLAFTHKITFLSTLFLHVFHIINSNNNKYLYCSSQHCERTIVFSYTIVVFVKKSIFFCKFTTTIKFCF